ncbi:PadR family transcriptional regulator [Thermoplasma sp.]|uniref:PadR family transcriptional regulator n=1 Tax=Thermoplasma sp. TaxID=1973142 RepID=UPI001278B1E7|nr:PadR family transcriptional regulator [Thermoplasma sp.]KAA8923116.1 MAG: PadR family transcriptional regulator [Thermoplasma sp.]
MFGNFGAFRKRGSLRYWILYLIYNKPMTGAEIMDEIEKHSFGLWRPSPGSIYPALDSLVSEGLITRREDGRYELSDKGKEDLGIDGASQTDRLKTPESILNEIYSYTQYLEDIVRGDGILSSSDMDRLRSIIRKLQEIEKIGGDSNDDNQD